MVNKKTFTYSEKRRDITFKLVITYLLIGYISFISRAQDVLPTKKQFLKSLISPLLLLPIMDSRLK